MSANYVAEDSDTAPRQSGAIRRCDERGVRAARDLRDRFDDLLAAITGIGFDAVDLWFGTSTGAGRRRSTSRSRASARSSRRSRRQPRREHRRHDGRSDCRACCLANDLDVDLIGGLGEVVRRDRDGAAAVLRAHGVQFGLENHPETRARCSAIGEDPTCSARRSTPAGGRRRATTRSPRSATCPIGSSTST